MKRQAFKIGLNFGRGFALDVLQELNQPLKPKSVDVIFLDAIKVEYPDYWKLTKPLLADEGILIADNVLGAQTWWIDHESDPNRAGADKLNRLLAKDSEFEDLQAPKERAANVSECRRRRRTCFADNGVRLCCFTDS